MLFNPDGKEVFGSIRDWAESGRKRINEKFNTKPLEYLKQLTYVRESGGSFVGGVGLRKAGDKPVVTSGVTLRSIFECVPESACLWDTMYAVTMFDDEPNIEKLNELFENNVSAISGELNIDGVRRALIIKDREEIKKRAEEIKRREKEEAKKKDKGDEKSIKPVIDDADKGKDFIDRYPLTEDAIIMFAVLLGYKVKAFYRPADFDCRSLIKQEKQSDLGLSNKDAYKRYLFGLINRSLKAFTRAKHLTGVLDAVIAGKGICTDAEWKEVETLCDNSKESIGRIEAEIIGNTSKINFQYIHGRALKHDAAAGFLSEGESWSNELALYRDTLVDRKERVAKDRWRLDRAGLRTTVNAAISHMLDTLAGAPSFDEVERIFVDLTRFKDSIENSYKTVHDDCDVALTDLCGYSSEEREQMPKEYLEQLYAGLSNDDREQVFAVQKFKDDFEAWVISVRPKIAALLDDVKVKKNEFAVNRKKAELRTVLAAVMDSVGTRDRKVDGKNNHEYIFAHLKNTETGEYINITNREDANKKRQSISAELQKLENCLASALALKREIGDEYFDDEANGMFVRLREFIEKLKGFRDIAERLASDSSNLPASRISDIVAGSEMSRTFRDEDSGLEITYTLRSDKTSELVFSRGENKGDAVHFYSAYHKVVDSAVDVKRQPVFADYGDITIYPYFKPFKYQVDSIRAMLSAFSGKGIFGDQVGLGKTIQTLLTAQVMSKCGTIRNAVIVVKKTIIEQWRKEAESKFRRNDDTGSRMFEFFPPPNKSLGLKELIKRLRQDKKDNKGGDNKDTLKVYFLSLESIKSARVEIEKANRIDAFRRNAFAVFTKKDMSGVSVFDYDIENEVNRDKLFILADMLIDMFKTELANDGNIQRMLSMGMSFRYGIEGKDGKFNVELDLTGCEANGNDYERAAKPVWKLDAPWKIACAKDNPCQFFELNRFNARLAAIYKRLTAIEAQIESERDDNIYNEELIDLFIFDEVQDMLSNLSSTKGDDADTSKLVREFIAGIQKKFCILVSATPIRDDLSDIFNLKYMIDKYSLGDTFEDAENRFYEGYCSGCRSLSQMASDNPKEKFKSLNGLINRTFTRKRLSDIDVTESMRRQCSTAEEREYALAHGGRNDYGGEKFINLVRAIVVAHNNKTFSDEDYAIISLAYMQALEHLSDETKSKITVENFIEYLRIMHERIDKSNAIETERLNARSEHGRRMVFNIDICVQFLELYKKLVELERINDGLADGKITPPEVIARHVKSCNMMCSYINRGLLDFYNNPGGDFSTVFLSEYIDWCRPIKRGVPIRISAPEEKTRLFGDALVPDREEDISYGGGLTADDIELMQRSKVLIFESTAPGRRDLYKRMRAETQNLGSSNRRVYMYMEDKDTSEFTEAELVDLCRYDKKGCGAATHKKLTEIVKRYDKLSPDARKRFDEDAVKAQEVANARSFIETWNVDGTPKSEVEGDDGGMTKDVNAVNTAQFSKVSIENGNWNSVYFMNTKQRAGRNFQAANVLIIGQLDFNEPGMGASYLDPLDFEQLIGRICRTGQTEQCVIYTCLYTSFIKNIPEFNEAYYDILSDKYGFDLFGECRTEVDFVVPVVAACIKRLFTPEYAYKDGTIGKISNEAFKADFDGVDGEVFKNDTSDFKAVFHNGVRPMEERDIKKFPNLLRYAYENRDKIDVYITDEMWYTEEDGYASEDVDGGVVVKTETKSVESGDGTSRRDVTFVTRKLDPVAAIKKMVRIYSQVLSHDVPSVEKKK